MTIILSIYIKISQFVLKINNIIISLIIFFLIFVWPKTKGIYVIEHIFLNKLKSLENNRLT